MKKKKLFIVIGKLGGGGAEHVVIRILRLVDRDRFLPYLVLFEREGVLIGEVPPDVPILDCGRRKEGGALRWLGTLVAFIRRESPDVVLSFMWFSNAVTILSCVLARVPCRVIVSERFTVFGAREGILSDIFRRISVSVLYGGAYRIVCNSEAMRRQFVDRFRFPDTKVVSIENPVDILQIVRQSGAVLENFRDCPRDLPIVVGMGRLSRQKGFDLLIRAVEKASCSFLLVLLGEGKEEERLKRLARRLGVGDRVRFAGFRNNPYPILRRTTVFVLSSRYEGFPNALVEAMALGLPCIATRCPTGPEEIVTDGETGLLIPVEDPGALARSIDGLLGDVSLRERLGKAAMESVRRYDAPRIVRRFESLLEEAAD